MYGKKMKQNEEHGKTTDRTRRKVKNNKNLVISVSEYIASHINEKISVIEIAAYFEKNPSYLNSKFKENTGVCITEYIQRIKIEEAKKRLINSDSSITEIWTNLAYYDQSHFIRHFKRETGLTPLQFREQNSTKFNAV